MDYELAKSLMDAGFVRLVRWTSWSGELAKLAANARFRGGKADIDDLFPYRSR
jgi:hypothetical protein